MSYLKNEKKTHRELGDKLSVVYMRVGATHATAGDYR